MPKRKQNRLKRVKNVPLLKKSRTFVKPKTKKHGNNKRANQIKKENGRNLCGHGKKTE